MSDGWVVLKYVFTSTYDNLNEWEIPFASTSFTAWEFIKALFFMTVIITCLHLIFRKDKN